MRNVMLPANPLGRFILERVAAMNLKRSEFAARMGYRNVSKGLRRLDESINTGRADRELLRKIALALGLSVVEINKVIHETNQYHFDEQRKAFVPYLLALCAKRIPSPIFVGAMTNGMRYRYYPCEELPTEHIDLLTFLRGEILDHFAQRNGGVAGFGLIVGYVFRREWEASREEMSFFETDGSLADDRWPDWSVWGSSGGLSLNGRGLLPLLSNWE